MKENKKKNILFKTVLATMTIVPLSSIGVATYFLLKNEINDTSDLIISDLNIKKNSISDFISVQADVENASDILPSEALKKENEKYFRSYLRYSLKPDASINDILEEYDVEINKIENSEDDFNGTLKIKMQATSKVNKDIKEERIFIVSGFKSTKVGDIRFKNRLNKVLNNFQFIQKQEVNSINYSEFNQNTFFNFFDLDADDSNEERVFNKVENEYFLKENMNYKANIELLKETYNNHNKTIDVIVSFSHSAFKNFSYGKVFTLENINLNLNQEENTNYNNSIFNNNINPYNLKFEKEVYNIFPSSFSEKSDVIIKDFSNINPNISIKLIKESINDQNGNIDFLVTDKITNFSKVFNFKLFNFDKISNDIFNITQINKNYINNSYNIISKKDLAVYTLNSSDKTLRYKTIGEEIEKYFNSQEFKNRFLPFKIDAEIFKYSLTKNFKIENNKLNFVLKNWNGDENNLFIPFQTPASDEKNISLDFEENPKIKSKEDVLQDIKNRTISIHYIVNENENTSRIISGTAWVFDRVKNTNTYYLATNIHVVSELTKNMDKISSFSYSFNTKYTKLPHLNSPITTEGVTYNQVFKRLDRRINHSFAEKSINKSRFITKESEEFWKNLEVINLGVDTPNKGEYSDFALIKVTFPKDKIIKNIFNQQYVDQYIPDQAKYYNDNKLNFFISDKIEFPQNTSDNNNLLPLPMELNYAGYLGGNEYVEVSQSPYLKYENLIQKEQTINNQNYKYNKSIINLPGVNSGHGMSGSLVLNQFGQVVGIFWGGFFDKETANGLSSGTGIIDTLSIKKGSEKTILRKWLDKTKNIITDLDEYEGKIKY
ncbi:DUF31 family putative serine protease [Mesomycoplasma molare]|uniref:DUF31 family protein n=1 Tax=Mesomycoplasma molare TaxID=171288 RepID=A0ABY5TTH2_9BACT|nr:lipoprotein 17-related variable surface protein [Mesomycoplasma molare]UWD33964.1 DUF31 family protein [Mesomycoplasma molare]